MVVKLEGVEEDKSHHEGEEANGFSKGESKNGHVEEFTTDTWVAANSRDKAGEDESNTDSGSGESNGGETGTNQFSYEDHHREGLHRMG